MRLEAQLAELREIIRQKDAELASCTCGRQTSPSVSGLLSPRETVAGPSPMPSVAELFGATQSSGIETSGPPSIADPPTDSLHIQDPITHPFDHIFTGSSELTFNTWPLNMPPPDLLHHLVETFFASVPLASTLLHRPSFMANLQQVPTSPDFPHVALLHAICAMASLYTPVVTEKPPDVDKNHGAATQFHSGLLFRAKGNEMGDRFLPRRIEDIMNLEEAGFGPLHVRWCTAAMRLAMQEGDRLIQLMQASVVCAWFCHSSGQSVNAFSWIGSACRMALPLGLNSSEGYEPLSRLPPHMLSLMQSPRNAAEAENPRNVFWLAYSLERILTAGTVWPLMLADDDISQIMPCRLVDFTAAAYVPTSGRQHLFTPKMLITHPPLTTDAFTLYTKASVLLGRVKTFNIRFKIRYTDGSGVATTNSYPYRSPGGSSYPYGSPSSTADAKLDARETAEFQVLDNLIKSFTANIPMELKDPVGLAGTKVNPVLYVAHMLPHVTMILLHDPHADLRSPNCLSAARILSAARAILDLIYKICATTYDLIYLDQACSFCWFVAGAAIIRFLKVNMDVGNEIEVTRLTQELGVVRFMLSNLGDRTVVGLRQIKLLDDIYDIEIGNVNPVPAAASGTAHVSDAQ